MEEILDFINRRFPKENDCNWTTGNCFYFAKILQIRFGGEIYYDLVNGHFLFMRDGLFFDWNGWWRGSDLEDFSRSISHGTNDSIVKWADYKDIDPLHYERIVRDVIM